MMDLVSAAQSSGWPKSDHLAWPFRCGTSTCSGSGNGGGGPCDSTLLFLQPPRVYFQNNIHVLPSTKVPWRLDDDWFHFVLLLQVTGVKHPISPQKPGGTGAA